MRYTALLFILCTLVAAEEHNEGLGPEQDGLRLRFLVEGAAGEADLHQFTIGIRNVSDKPVTLVAQFFYDDSFYRRYGRFRMPLTYRQYVKLSTTYTSFPEVLSDGYQSGGAARRTREPEVTIEPGQEFCTRWTVEGRQLDAQANHWFIVFPTPGRFDLRAHLQVVTADGRSIGLYSGMQPFVVGGSEKAPKRCTATVGQADAEHRLVYLLGVNVNDGVRKGDRFLVRIPRRGSFLLEVTEFHEKGLATMLVNREWNFVNGEEPPTYPAPGLKAGLEPEVPRQAAEGSETEF